MKWLSLLLCCLALGLVAVGCGDDDEDGDDASTATIEQPADTGTGADTATDSGAGGGAPAVAVGMKDIQFVPERVTVKAGQTVKWTNGDSVTHTVTKESGPGPKFDSGNLEVGATFEQKFTKPGKVDYVCTIHPNQTGTVTVE